MTRLARLFAVDPRSLALFRVVLGSLVLLDLFARSRDLADHYSDWGLLPRQALTEESDSAYRFCVHAWSGAASFEALIFAVAAALAVAFIVGRGGVAVAALLWVLTVSLQNRNGMVLNKGDQIFRLLLFWSMFVPQRATGPVLSVGSAALMIQAALVWLVSACLKTDRAWFPDGTATYYALQMDHGTTAFGHWLGRMFVVTRGLTYGVYVLEWAAAFLLFSPVYTTALRAATIVALVGMHVGFGLSLRLGFFPAISICSLMPFIPAALWDCLGVRAGGAAWRSRCRMLGSTLASAALLLVLWVNAAVISRGGIVVPPVVDRVAQMLRLDQVWGMFAPFPDRAGGWYVIPGHLADGTVVDAYHPSLTPPKREKPERLSSTFSSSRWLYYMTNLAKPQNAHERPWFAWYLCRRFDAAHESAQPLRDLDVTFFREWVLPGYERTPATEEVLWRGKCNHASATAMPPPRGRARDQRGLPSRPASCVLPASSTGSPSTSSPPSPASSTPSRRRRAARVARVARARGDGVLQGRRLVRSAAE